MCHENSYVFVYWMHEYEKKFEIWAAEVWVTKNAHRLHCVKCCHKTSHEIHFRITCKTQPVYLFSKWIAQPVSRIKNNTFISEILPSSLFIWCMLYINFFKNFFIQLISRFILIDVCIIASKYIYFDSSSIDGQPVSLDNGIKGLFHSVDASICRWTVPSFVDAMMTWLYLPPSHYPNHWCHVAS